MDHPRTVNALDPAGLSAEALSRLLRIDGGRISSLQVSPVGDGRGAMSRTARIALTYDGPATGAPATLIAKYTPSDPEMRAIGQSLGLYRREIGFYQELASRVQMLSPRCYAAQIAEERGEFLLLLEDITAAQNGDRAAGCSPAVARQAVIELAALHAVWWQRPLLTELGWLQPFDPGPLQETYQRAWGRFVELMGSQLSDELRTVGERLGRRLSAVFDQYWAAPWTLVHNDFQLDNLFFRPDGAITVIDWQSVVRGQGAMDLAGFLGGNVSVAQRRATEADLVQMYHTALRERGVTGYALDDCWRGYRLALFDGFSRMVIALASNLTPRQAQVHREILWPRYSAAVLDLRCDALLDELGAE